MSGNLGPRRGSPGDLADGLVLGRPEPGDPAPSETATSPGLDVDFAFRSDLDRALTWYRGQLALRRLVGALALPALLALAGLGMIIDPGTVPWLVATLAFLAAAEITWTTTQLRRRR